MSVLKLPPLNKAKFHKLKYMYSEGFNRRPPRPWPLSDAPLIGLNAPLKNHCLAWDSLVPFLEYALERNSLPLKITKFKAGTVTNKDIN